MILTGKAKEAFLKHSIGKEIALFEVMLPIYQHALIIEWLDSVGIYVEVGYLHAYKEWYRKVSTDTGSCYIRGWESRQQATEKAIERAVELFNGK